jgi:hypothetical protein
MRSARLNTEMAVVVGSAPLCERLHADFVRKILDFAYRLELLAEVRRDAPHLVWITCEGCATTANPTLSPCKEYIRACCAYCPSRINYECHFWEAA